MNSLITSMATRNEVINPTRSDIHSCVLIVPEYERMLYELAASIVGIARKKENSTAVFLLAPRNDAPTMLAADREVPGIIARH